MEKNKSAVTQYNNAKLWQIGFFSLNNCATNIAMFLMMQYSYFTQNVLGLAAAIVGLIATGTRIFDAVTDPLVGFWWTGPMDASASSGPICLWAISLSGAA